LKRFPETTYNWRITTPVGDVDLIITNTQWDTAGEVTLRYLDGYYHLRQYFLTHGHGMYGHAIDLDDKMMIPEDIHHILLMNETMHHRTDLIQEVKLLIGFVPDKAWMQYIEENAGLMDGQDD
jgi:hypothetical protein